MVGKSKEVFTPNSLQACCPDRPIIAKAYFARLEQPQHFIEIFKGFFQKLQPAKPLKACLVSILHTFGKDIKFHPHLHILTNHDINFNCKFNKLWRKTILDSLNLTSNKNYYGYYVWSDAIKSKNIAKYIGRYVRHPAIANSRITEYNKQSISFFYKDAKGSSILVRKSITDFITCLIQHIPPKQFKMIRYYGIYNKNKEF